MTTRHYFAEPDENLEAYWNALDDSPIEFNQSVTDFLRQIYLRLNDKWRNELLTTLWILCDEIDEGILTDSTINNIREGFQINPNILTTREINLLLEWSQK